MKRLFVGITFFLTLAASVFAQNDLQPLAIVKLNKSETITMKELRARVEFLQKQTGAKSFTVEQKKQILDSLISEKLVAQGLMAGIGNIVTTAIVGTLLCVAYAASKPKKGSLKEEK